MFKFAVGFIKVEKNKTTYVYGSSTEVNDYLIPFKNMKRCRFTQPVSARYFETEKDLHSHMECIMNTYSNVSDGENLMSKIKVIKI